VDVREQTTNVRPALSRSGSPRFDALDYPGNRESAYEVVGLSVNKAKPHVWALVAAEDAYK
jgi:hypothetical protein